MKFAEQKKAAKQFAKKWEGRGYEKGESQSFWLSLLAEVYGVRKPTEYIKFEKRVQLGNTSFIDGYIERVHVLIEQKSLGKDLSEKEKQSDGSMLTPYEQAKRYAKELPYSQYPRWIVVSNFAEFHVHDMEAPQKAPDIIRLKDLPEEYHRLNFLIDEKEDRTQRETKISVEAGDLVRRLYDALRARYDAPSGTPAEIRAKEAENLRSLNVLCVRIVFCLYAEDAGLFGKKAAFHDFICSYNPTHVRDGLIDLFRWLDQKPEERDTYKSETFRPFPYVNGGLFRDEKIIIPTFTQEIIDLIVHECSERFDWSTISPTIFGAVFESTMNQETRRSGGMHYTSIQNIHKVIDPLFLDALNKEFREIIDVPEADKFKKNKKYTELRNDYREKLENFQKKLASLKFLDPACGSGNFLTETYLCIRRMENKILTELNSGNQMLDMGAPIKVAISQFCGIEINDFAVTVARTALWIAESQMMQETEELVRMDLDFLPLKTNANIIEGNALRMDWETVVPKRELSYIMGNPPFVGFTYMTASQKADMQEVFPKVKNLDYVCCWYKLASEYTQGADIETALVSTNSIVQGETAARFWPFMKNDVINFACRTFRWDNESNQKAQVHCIIIGFAKYSRRRKQIFDGDNILDAENINEYLLDGENILVQSHSKPLCDVPGMLYGNKPADGGNLIIEDEELEDFIKKDPSSRQFIRPFLGAKEFINGKKRWCLWLVGASPEELKKCPQVLQRIRQCREIREKSIAAAIRKFAETPALFCQIAQPDSDYIIVPRHSSEKRRYIPLGFMPSSAICGDANMMIPHATLYHFGVLTSNVHMAWMRVVAGRLKSDYRYSRDIVYNTFPWPSPTDAQRAKIEASAKAILDARARYPESSLAALYDRDTMPPDLLKAHYANDFAVMEAYGFEKGISESESVARLMRMYRALTEKQPPEKKSSRQSKKA